MSQLTVAGKKEIKREKKSISQRQVNKFGWEIKALRGRNW